MRIHYTLKRVYRLIYIGTLYKTHTNHMYNKHTPTILNIFNNPLELRVDIL